MPLVASTDPAAITTAMVRSHRFAAANTAVPFVNGDRAQLDEVQKFLRDGQITVDVFALVRGMCRQCQPPPSAPVPNRRLASTFAVGEESLNFGAARTVVQQVGEVIGPLDQSRSVGQARRVRAR